MKPKIYVKLEKFEINNSIFVTNALHSRDPSKIRSTNLKLSFFE